MKPRISMITLGVSDLARSIKFYEEGLGFPRMESDPGVAFFTLNGTWLGLYGREALAEVTLVLWQLKLDVVPDLAELVPQQRIVGSKGDG